MEGKPGGDADSGVLFPWLQTTIAFRAQKADAVLLEAQAA